MPNYRATWELNLDGDKVRVLTTYPDMLWAERAMGENPANFPLDLQAHMWYSALRHQHPEHPAGKTYRGFTEALWAAEEISPEEAPSSDGNGLDPTPVAVSEG